MYDLEPRASKGISGRMQPGEVGIANVAASRVGLKNFRMDSQYRNGRLWLQGFTANLGSGTVRAKGSMDWSNPHGPHKLSVEFDNVDIVKAFRVFDVILDAEVTGPVSGSLNVTWNGLKSRQARRSMNGTASFQFGSGQVAAMDVFDRIAAVTVIPELAAFRFDSGTASADIKNGMMSFQIEEVAGPYERIRGNGVLNLYEETIDARGEIALSPRLAGRSSVGAIRALGMIAGAMESDSRERYMTLPFLVTMQGKVADPLFNLVETVSSASDKKHRSE